MANFHPAEKLIAVSDKNGHTIAVLKNILTLCGRSSYHVAPAGGQLPPGVQPAVLLLCDAVKAGDAGQFSVCVAGYEFAALPELSAFHPLTYSVKSDSADFTARNIRQTQDGFTAFEIVGVGVIGRVKLAVRTPDSIETVLAAAAAAIACGIPFAEVLEAVNNMQIED